MPLQDVGYRAWNNERCGPSSTIWVIAFTGIRLAWESRWLRRMVFFAWSPALIFAASFFAFEQAVDEGRLTSLGAAAQRGRNLDGIGLLGTVLVDALGGSADEVDVETPSQTEVVLKSHNKQILGQAAAEIRAFRPPEPYKGKGVRYSDEQVKRKEAKKAAGTGA